jgi:SAM-dependent methyltransferase
MCDPFVLNFVMRALPQEEITGASVLEVGSRNVNGSAQEFLRPFAGKYVGIDIEEGEGVDLVLSVHNAARILGKESFDIVLSTEMLEHVEDWRSAISNMKAVVKPGGLIVITTRSIGFAYHEFPGDFWRYEVPDMLRIFDDFDIQKLEAQNPPSPGVFLKARKYLLESPAVDLGAIELYRMEVPEEAA